MSSEVLLKHGIIISLYDQCARIINANNINAYGIVPREAYDDITKLRRYPCKILKQVPALALSRIMNKFLKITTSEYNLENGLEISALCFDLIFSLEDMFLSKSSFREMTRNIINQMVVYGGAKFKKYTHMLEDYEIENGLI